MLFNDYIDKNQDKFLSILHDEEIAVFEFLICKHTIGYNLPHEPLVLLDIINNKTRKRKSYAELIQFAKVNNFTLPKLIHSGEAISINEAIVLLGKGGHGADPNPEGLVYRYERKNEFYVYAKFVNGFIEPVYHTFEEMCIDKMIKNKYI